LQQIVDQATDPWGIKIEMVEMKDVEIPESMQRAMAREAEAIREKRARIIKAEAELAASEKLAESARIMSDSTIALELRRMQMLSEIGIDNNTTTVILMPSEFTNAAKTFSERINNQAKT
jgi:regulator of protease activity HflC (stomatin/prohibitin superfamily)